MVEVFTLKVDLCATEFVRQPLRVINRTGTTDVVFELALKLGDKRRIGLRLGVFQIQLKQRRLKCLSDKRTAILAEVTRRIRVVVGFKPLIHVYLPFVLLG